jgi:hypothetical protein
MIDCWLRVQGEERPTVFEMETPEVEMAVAFPCMVERVSVGYFCEQRARILCQWVEEEPIDDDADHLSTPSAGIGFRRRLGSETHISHSEQGGRCKPNPKVARASHSVTDSSRISSSEAQRGINDGCCVPAQTSASNATNTVSPPLPSSSSTVAAPPSSPLTAGALAIIQSDQRCRWPS